MALSGGQAGWERSSASRFQPYEASVLAAMNTSDPVWVICQFTRPSGGRDAQAAPCVRSWREARWRSLGPSSIPSLGDSVMFGTAWIDRAPCFHVLLSAAWKHGHAQANDRHSSCVFATPPRGFARTTRNG
jgi:hypothetical protein